ncbi:hypothetical protein D9613_000074 [Agrocybe pediades]|uniref:F-box domain-containing protein n=1 Tax=Agrocybe pediades TaxID=84607 RepID=A0A8H4VUB8_9AGAR|nr:hypothetical protein D9613_000074 [Agrocybe pediades]
MVNSTMIFWSRVRVQTRRRISRLRHFVRGKIFAIEYALRHQRNVIRHLIWRGTWSLRRKAHKASKRTKSVKRKAGRAARDFKDSTILSLPGVSKARLPAPPVPHLLKSNDRPTEQEAILIRQAIKSAEVELTRLRHIYVPSALAGERVRSSVAWCKIQQTKSFIRQHKALLSPIRLLPAEMWEDIFAWLSPCRQMMPHISIAQKNADVPWAVAQVCRNWRMHALSMPALWAYLPAISLAKSKSEADRQLEYLGELIRRSRGNPLKFHIESPHSRELKLHPIITLLCQHSEQWGNVSMSLPTATIASGFQSIEGRLPLLRTLSLSVFHTGLGWYQSPLTIFAVAPKLSTVSLQGTLAQDVIRLPYRQLVNYEGQYMLRHDHIIGDNACSLLETLTVLDLQDYYVFPPATTLPHLKKLYVKFPHGAHERCFDNLILPSIKEIRILTSQGAVMRSLALMLSKCGLTCPVERLYVRDQSIVNDAESWTNVLAQTPLLTYLDFNLPVIPADIYELANGHLAPMLETCHFYVGGVIRQDISAALNVLASRRCELAATSDGFTLRSEVELEAAKPLKELSVYFQTYGSDCVGVQQSLENWQESKTGRVLRNICGQLRKEQPGRYGWYGWRKAKLDLGWKNRVMGLLNQVEGIDITSVNDIYYSQIHYLLKEIAASKFRLLASKAQQILNKWEPMFKSSLNDCHWACKGRSSVVYIPNNHACRRSADDAMSIVFGLKKDWKSSYLDNYIYWTWLMVWHMHHLYV